MGDGKHRSPPHGPRTGVFMDEVARDAQRHVSPSAERNLAPLLETLADVLPPAGRVLELGSGTGQHAAAFAAAFPRLTWQPSDADAECRASIAAWCRHAALPNLEPPLALNLLDADWEARAGGPCAALLAVNVLHIAPWAAAEGLLRGAAALLEADGALIVYGPFRRDGDWVSEGNARFDRSLRHNDPAWGVRDTADVAAAAAAHGLALVRTVPMPANNTTLVLARKR